MLTPLVVLAGLSVVMGIIQLPDVDVGARLVRPPPRALAGAGRRVRRANIDGTWAIDHKTILMLIATAASVAGIIARLARLRAGPHQGRRAGVLANAWYYDKAVTDFMGGPGEDVVRGVPPGSTPTSSTAPSTAPAERVRDVAGELRKGQTGYVRGYAGIIGIGVVVLLGWFVVVRGIL